MSAVTKIPIQPVVAITKNDNSTYNYNPFTGTFDFRIQSLTCSPPVDSQGGTFNMKIVSSDASNSNANTLLNNIECGNLITFQFGKSNSTLTKIMLGVIESIVIDEGTNNSMIITLTGPDWGSDILKNRIVQYYKTQLLSADGVTYDNTDTSVSIYNLYNNLLSLASAYPFNDGITAAAQGIVISQSNFDSSLYGTNPTLVPSLVANDEKLDDKLSELDNWANLIHYVDANKNIFVRPANASPTYGSWLFTDDPNDTDASTWKTGYVGYLEPGTNYKYTIENYKHRIIGLGGDQVAVDQSQTTNNSSTQLDSNWIAMKFTPVQYRAYSIRIYVAKVGLPTSNLQMQLVMDNGGKPTGTVVRTLSMDYNSIGTSGGWIEFNIGDEYQIGNSYWIVLPQIGNVSNTFKWYNDNGSSSTYATSSDGITWTTHSSSLGYMFQTKYSSPLIQAMPGNGLSASDKAFREEVYRRPYITDRQSLSRYLATITALTNYKKEILTGRIYSPDNMITPFEQVVIKKTKSGLQFTGLMNYFLLGKVDYIFQGGDGGGAGIFYVNFQAVRFTTYP